MGYKKAGKSKRLNPEMMKTTDVAGDF